MMVFFAPLISYSPERCILWLCSATSSWLLCRPDLVNWCHAMQCRCTYWQLNASSECSLPSLLLIVYTSSNGSTELVCGQAIADWTSGFRQVGLSHQRSTALIHTAVECRRPWVLIWSAAPTVRSLGIRNASTTPSTMCRRWFQLDLVSFVGWMYQHWLVSTLFFEFCSIIIISSLSKGKWLFEIQRVSECTPCILA